MITTTCYRCNGTGFDPDCWGHATDQGRVWCECLVCDGIGGQYGDGDDDEPCDEAA